ncbi:MAG: nitrate ABC transporter permease [Clostridia bacterium]|nr:nitrate ABC transporter permease [Clostridia bacterium]
MPRSTIKPHKNGIRPWAAALWIIIWQLAAMLVGRDFLLASPLDTIIRFFELAFTGGFWSSALFSLARIFSGFLLGMVSGAVLAALSARHRRVREALAPLLMVLRAIPVASFVIVALIWVPSRNLSVLVCFLISFPVVYAGVLSEIGRTDPRMIEMARLFGMAPARQLIYVYALPAMRGFETTCATAIGLAWKSGTAAELISIPSGSIGERLYQAKVYLMTGDLFAWTILIVLLSSLCSRLFCALLRCIARRLEGV